MTTSASSATRPASSSSALSTPAWYASPTVPPAPSTRAKPMFQCPPPGTLSGGPVPPAASVGGIVGGGWSAAEVLGGQVLRHGPPEHHQAVAPVAVDAVEEGDHVLGDRLRLGRLVVEDPGHLAVAGQHEAAVVDAALGAEALGQASAPGPLLAGGPVAGAGNDVLEPLEGLEAGGVGDAGAHQHVLVREGQHRPPVLVGHDRPQHGVPLGRPLHRGQADEERRGAPDALQGAEGEPKQAACVAGLGDQHPLLPLLRQEADVETGRAGRGDIGHVRQLGVTESGAILGLDLDRHDLLCAPRGSKTTPGPASRLPGRSPPPATPDDGHGPRRGPRALPLPPSRADLGAPDHRVGSQIRHGLSPPRRAGSTGRAVARRFSSTGQPAWWNVDPLAVAINTALDRSASGRAPLAPTAGRPPPGGATSRRAASSSPCWPSSSWCWRADWS